MVLINKQPKLSCHMASMPINDRRLIKPVMLICFCSAKFLLKGVNIVSFSWTPFIKCLKVNLGLGGRRS